MADSSSKKLTRKEILDSVMMAIREMSALSVIISQTVAEKVGINSTDMECGDFLQIYGPMTAGKLAELSGLTTGAITGVIDRLEKANLAKREFDPSDRRKVLVVPSQKRAKEFESYYASLGKSASDALDRYTTDQLNAFLSISRDMIAISQTEIKLMRDVE
ncbi:transcriptional regulator, MarR family [Leptospira fainei serovar Hurstbridge str. BUT 6]|uniref:Transcriptional regulator, MarR family n=1 Tax=Leptospira fainei serovar Hurstbridge str. BUT 6 TaxID=1193011 RepID=S3VAK3_9LEPT|nr:MarR family transcriptional regulator [Leptospira fainei]EPG73475.1 transcriptional regulator, MarR family [Leptospira fainei serovar Hurstbridge str. BUT 6]